MHTTHATRLFLDVTRHMSRMHIHACKHISRRATAYDVFVYIFTALREKRNLHSLLRKERPSIYIGFLFHLIRTFLFFSILIKIWYSVWCVHGRIIFNNKLLPVHETPIFKHFSQFVFCYLSERKLRLPEHPVHTCRMDEIPIGFPISAPLDSLPRGG